MNGVRAISAICIFAGLTACEDVIFRPTPEAAHPASVAISAPSAASQAIRTYYARVENDLLVQGLLRTDGGGPDTPYSPDLVTRNFERIAFYDEHKIGTQLEQSSGEARLLSRWTVPVRIKTEFGSSVSVSQREEDGATIKAFADRLAKVTDHPISTTAGRANFHVMVSSKDDAQEMKPRIAELLPNMSSSNLELLSNLPRDMHCLVVVSHADTQTPQILSALALVRAEHPDLLRKACFHEEIAQGLGLVNDSRQARPSIFNDDDEFALLTSHDEVLLSMLYDSRLKIGMSADQARPVIRILAREELGQDL